MVSICVELTIIGLSGAKLLQLLSNYDHQRQYRDRARRRLENTTGWISNEPVFQSWLRDGNPQCLWLTGISKASYPGNHVIIAHYVVVGCGKSITLY
jgi:hypothetical protein